MSDTLALTFSNRFPAIIEALKATVSESGFRVLCLQEVDEESLPILLENTYIRKNFPFSSHKPCSLLRSRRNLGVLSNRSFEFHLLPFPQPHKSALIATFNLPCILIANIHLTSSLTDVAVATKVEQMRILNDCLSGLGTGAKFVAGDFNLTSSSRTIQNAIRRGIITHKTRNLLENSVEENLWADLFTQLESFGSSEYPGEEGATFNPFRNPLAASTKFPGEKRPERYDRILSWKEDCYKLKSFTLFG